MDNETRFYLRRSRVLQRLLIDGSIHPTGRIIGALMILQTSPGNQTVTTGQDTLADWAGLTGKNKRATAGKYVRQLVAAGYFHCLSPGGYNAAKRETWTGSHRVNLNIADDFQLRRAGPPPLEGARPSLEGGNRSLAGGSTSLCTPHEYEGNEEGAASGGSAGAPPASRPEPFYSDFKEFITIAGGRLGEHYEERRAFERYKAALAIYSEPELAEKYKARLDDDKRKAPGFATFPEKFLMDVCERRVINGSASGWTPGPSSTAPASTPSSLNPIDRSSSAEVEARDGLLAMRGISLEDFDDMLAGCSTCWADDFSREEVEGLAAWHLTDGSGLEDIGLCLSSERRKDWSEGTPSWVEQFGEAKAIAEQEAEQRAAAGD